VLYHVSEDVPAIIGADMKTYCPFKVEDIAFLPVKNAKILIKQGLAEKLELINHSKKILFRKLGSSRKFSAIFCTNFPVSDFSPQNSASNYY
jgi:hypothetical protein